MTLDDKTIDTIIGQINDRLSDKFIRITPMKLAKVFHHHYERLAPEFGYKTRRKTREFDEKSSNGQLMIATCRAVLEDLINVKEAP